MKNERFALIAELIKSLDEEPATPEQEQKEEMPRMRTIPAAVAEVRAADPETALTVSALRRAVKQGKIPVVEVNTKRLVNLSDVFSFMSGAYAAPAQSKNEIRRVI